MVCPGFSALVIAGLFRDRGREGGSPRTVVAEGGDVKLPVPASIHPGPQVVACRTQTAELLFDSGLRQVATVGDVPRVDASVLQCRFPRAKIFDCWR